MKNNKEKPFDELIKSRRKVPFDLKYREKIESGEYQVITRDGYKVRILCWDADGECPIVYQVNREYKNSLLAAHKNGMALYNNIESDNDLLVLSEEEILTDFENDVVHFYERASVNNLNHSTVVDYAKNLYKKAIEEYKNSGGDYDGSTLNLIKEKAFNKGKEEGKVIGRNEVLDKLPHWKPNGMTFDKDEKYRFGSLTIYRWDGYWLDIRDLDKLENI